MSIYLLVSKDTPSFEHIISECQIIHETDNKQLSCTPVEPVEGEATKALVKVDDVDAAWLALQPWAGEVEMYFEEHQDAARQAYYQDNRMPLQEDFLV